jgi:hypothetical protein
MTARNFPEFVKPVDYPELHLLAWNRDPGRAIPAFEAFDLYEGNWRHVDTQNLTPREAALIGALTAEFGRGFLLATGAAPNRPDRSA